MSIIAFLQANWSMLLVDVICIFIIGLNVHKFLKSADEKQKQKVIEWLLFYVAQAEKELGGGTGQLKLRYVYDAFVIRFPKVAAAISFETFSEWVDIALDQFKGMLKENTRVQEYVGN